MMKKKATLLLVFAFLAFIFPLFTTQVNAGTYYSTITSSFELKYNVTDFNTTSTHTDWYTTSFSFVASWDADINQTVNATVNQTTNEITFDLEIGNITLINVTNSDIAFNLALSITMAWYGGLIIDSTDWTAKNASAQTAASAGNLTVTETSANITFHYNDSVQNSTMKYDKRTGILLESWCSSLNFYMGLDLLSSLPNAPPSTPPIPGFEALFIISAVLLLVLVHYYLRKYKSENELINI